MPKSPSPLKRHADFHKLWAAVTLSAYGSHFGTMAIALAAAITFKASPLEVSILGAAATLPGLLLGLQSGVWVDRFSRKRVLLIGDAFRGVVLLGAVALLVLGHMNLWILCLVALLLACATVPYDIAMLAYLPAVVKGSASLTANARCETSRSTANLAAPALAGTLFAVVQAPFILFLDALTFFASWVLIGRVKAIEPAPAPPPGSTWAQVKSGLQFVSRHPFLGPLGICSGLVNFFRIMFWSFMVVYQLEVLRLTPFELGLVNGLGSVGMIAASLVATPALNRFGVKNALIAGALCSTVPLLVLCVFTADPPLAGLIAVQAVHGFGWVLYHANQLGFRQLITPPALRGRMNATLRFYEWAATPVAAVLGGVLATTIGMRPALVVAAIAGIVACLALRWLRVPAGEPVEKCHQYPSAEERFGAALVPESSRKTDELTSVTKPNRG